MIIISAALLNDEYRSDESAIQDNPRVILDLK
jgi:hypothetical protein